MLDKTILKKHMMPFSLTAVVVVLSACNASPGNVKADSGETSEDQSMEVRADAAVRPAVNPFSLEPDNKTGGALSSATVIKEGQPVPTELTGDLLFNLLAAEFAGNAGNLKASVNYYQQAAKSAQDPRIHARAAYIAVYGEQYEDALTALNSWYDLEPESANLLRLYVVTYLKLGEPQKAVPYIQKLFDHSQATPRDDAVALKALLAKEASIADSLIVLQSLNRVAEPNNYMLVLQARYEAQEKHYDAAIALLDDVYQSDNSMIEVLIIKARILTTTGDKAGATREIKQALEQRPDNNALRLQYARMLVEQEALVEAKQQYLIAHEKLPDNNEVRLALALLYIDTKELDKATAELHELVERDSRVSIANYYLGRIAQNNGDKEQAIAYYLQVKNERFTFDAKLRIASLLTALGRADDGLKVLEALAEDQDDWTLRVRVYLAQGEILRAQHRFVEGVEMYSRALQEKRNDTNLLYARGLMAEKVDRLDMAEADFLNIISQEPENANALNALGYTLADRTGRYKEALEYIKRAAELIPDDPAILDSLGWVSFRLGKLDEAEKWLAKAFAKLSDAEIAAHYGEVLWVMNKKEQARNVWQKGKLNNAKHPVLLETLERIKP